MSAGWTRYWAPQCRSITFERSGDVPVPDCLPQGLELVEHVQLFKFSTRTRKCGPLCLSLSTPEHASASPQTICIAVRWAVADDWGNSLSTHKRLKLKANATGAVCGHTTVPEAPWQTGRGQGVEGRSVPVAASVKRQVLSGSGRCPRSGACFREAWHADALGHTNAHFSGVVKPACLVCSALVSARHLCCFPALLFRFNQ